MSEKPTTDDWFEGLTEKQRRFCEAFTSNGGNALDAARTAGYGKPDPEGARALGNARIKAALEKLRSKTTSLAIATREDRQNFWTRVMEDESQSMRDRLRAAELLGKSQADFIERREITGANGDPFKILLDEISGKSIGPK